MKIELIKPFRIFDEEYNEESIDLTIETNDIDVICVNFERLSIDLIFQNNEKRHLTFSNSTELFNNVFLFDMAGEEFHKDISYSIFYINKMNYRLGYNSDTNILTGYKEEIVQGFKSLNLVYEASDKPFVDLIKDFIIYIKTNECLADEEFYSEEYLDIESLRKECEENGYSYKEIQEEVWILKEEYKQGGLKSPFVKYRKVKRKVDQEMVKAAEMFAKTYFNF